MDFNFSASHVSSVAGSGAGSLASSKNQQRPSLSVYLSASTAAPKKVGTPNNRVVQTILHDLDRIKRSKPRRRLQKCERLVYFIVQALRNRPRGDGEDGGEDDDGDVPLERSATSSSARERDHLLETTTIWALTHLLRVDSRYTKEVMLGAGVPGLLFDIMSSHSLTGATRQYASELCYFLTSADEEFPQAGPLKQMGPVPTGHMQQQTHHNDRFPQGSYLAGQGGQGGGGYAVGGSDDASFAGSELSSLAPADERGRLPFVPYRISDDNMARLDALFAEADKDIRASKDINVNESRRAGTAGRRSKPPRTELHNTTFPSAHGDGDASTRYSRHGLGLGRLDMIDDLDDRSISSSISSQSQSQDGGGVYSIADRLSGLVESGSLRTLRPWQSQSTLEHTLAGSVARPDSMYSEDSRDNVGAKSQSRRLFHVRATPQIQPPPRRNGKPARSTTRGFLDRIVQQSNAHFALDARLGQAASVGGDSQGSGFGWGRDERDDADARTAQTGSPSLAASLSPRGSLLDSLSPRKDGAQGQGGGFTPRRIRLASLDREHDMPPANRLLSPQQSRRMHSAEQPSPQQQGQQRNSPAASPSLRLDLSLSDASSYSRSRLSVASATEPSDVPAFLASLDPLSLSVTRGLAAHILDGGPSAASSLAVETNADDVSVYSRSDDDEDDDDGGGDYGHDAVAGALLAPGQTAEQWAAANAHLQQQDPEYYNTALGALERAKQTKAKRRVRIRAEKLVDHRFTRLLFSKRASLHDTMLLVKRLQDVLELVDADRSGYVTWEYFGRAVLALAPPKLLRADVQAFLDAQSDDPQALIDYREFVISGKLVVVQRQNGRAILPINGWLERQRLYTGDASTLSWKRHVEWYNARQAEAVIWLMRRANRAFAKSDQYVRTWQGLRNIGRRALAFAYLSSLGAQAEQAGSGREAAKRFLLQRCHHARLRMTRRAEAQRYLSALAFKVVELEAIKVAAEERLRAEDVFVEKATQAGYAKLYLVHFQQISCRERLRWYGQRAVRHTARTETDFAWLVEQARLVMLQLQLRENAFEWLLRAAQRYHEYCIVKDTCLLSLLRIGGKALAYLDRQMAACDWLLARGKRGQAHAATAAATGLGLCAQGQRTLRFLNNREHALAHCLLRRRQAEALIARQADSVAFFRSLVGRLWANAAKLVKAQAFLAEKAASAAVFLRRRDHAYLRLVYVAGRAHVVRRRAVTTFIDLQQMGQFARASNFNRYWMGVTENRARVHEEVRRHEGFDKKKAAERASLPLRQRWRVELEEAFVGLALGVLLPGESVNDKASLLDADRTPLVTRVGFGRLMLQGRLLGLLPADLDNAWHEVDPRATGYTTFEGLWDQWFEGAAIAYHRQLIAARRRGPAGSAAAAQSVSKTREPGLYFTLADILSPLDRVLVVYRKRFAAQEMKIAFRAAAGEDDDEEGGAPEDDDDDDDEEEEEEEEEEDVVRPISSQDSRSNRTPQEKEYDALFSRLLGAEEGAMDPYEESELSFEQAVQARAQDKAREREEERARAVEAEAAEEARQAREEEEMRAAARLLPQSQ